ncbi:MAG: PAS domain S-box protein [Chromatiaceae bacterium]|nr:PAS domain S-box protein [Chromatiaceae bacterium]
MNLAETINTAVLQEICTTIANKTGCTVAIMANKGEIIASSNPARIGILHPGAARILSNEVDFFDVTPEMARESDSMLEGRSLPIELAGKRVATVGVTAPLSDSRKYSAIVQTCVTVMLERELNHQKAQLRLNEQIAKQRKVETALRRSETKLKEMRKMVGIGHWVWNVDTGEVEWSEEVYQIFGLNPDEFTPQIDSILNLSPWPEENQRDKELIEKAMYSHKKGSYEQRFLRPDGSTGYYYSTFQGVYNESGDLIAIQGAVQDITARKEAQQALELSDARFRDFANTAADWFWEMGPDLRFTYLTGRVEEVMGLTPEEIIGKTREDIYREGHNQESPPWREYKQRIADHEAFSDFEICWRRPDGKERYITLSGKPLHDAKGIFLGYRGIGSDITGRKKQQEEVAHLRNYLVNIINSMPSVLIGVDTQGSITQWNDEARRATGTPFEKALGQPLTQVFPRLTNELERISEAIKSSRMQSDLKRPYQQNDETRFEDVIIFPLIANGVDGAVIRLDDVTERVRLEEMMIQSEKMLSVGGLAAGVAHEINNPLAGMMQTASVMRNRLTDLSMPANLHAAEEVGISMESLFRFMEKRNILRMLEDISNSGKRVSEIVENMLSFARKSDSGISSHDLAELMDRTLELAATDYNLKKHYDFKTICIIREYADNLPPVPCESAKIQQVLLNILKNGAEAMYDADGFEHKFILRLRHDAERSMVCIEIEDNGPGMDEATRRRVFEPFFTTKPVGIGTGLGLSVSYFIITEIHAGRMAVESQPGSGAKFIICLPVDAVREAKEKYVTAIDTGSI